MTNGSKAGVLWRCLLILAVGSGLLVAYNRLVPIRLIGDTYGVLEAARNLSRGLGLVTYAAPSEFLPYYLNLTPPFPYVMYPLVPIVTSWLFRAFGANPSLMVVFPMAMYLTAGIGAFEIGRRLFTPLTGLLAALALLLQPLMLETPSAGNLSDPVLVALLVGTVLCVVIASDDAQTRPMAWLVAGGALLGLCQYARWAATALYLPMIVLVTLASPRQRLVRTGVVLLSCLAIQAPLFIWNVRHVGTITLTPTYVFLFLTPSFPAERALVSVLPADFPVFRQYGREVVMKWVGQLWVHYKYFFEITSPVLLVAAMMFGFRSLPRQQRALWTFTVVLYLTIAGLNSWFMWYNRYLLPVVPFAALLGVECIRATVAAAPFPSFVRAGAAVMFAALVAAQPVDLFYQLVKSRPQPGGPVSQADPRAEFMRASLRPGDVVMSVDAPLIAWETGNVSVGLPLNPAAGVLVHDRYVRFNTLVLETRKPRVDIHGFDEEWFQIARGEKSFLDFRAEQSVALSADQRLVLFRSGSAAEAR